MIMTAVSARKGKRKMEKNIYIENVKEIAKLGAQRGVDWNVALDMYDKEQGNYGKIADGERNAQLKEFLDYVAGKKFDKDGNYVGTV